MTLTWLLILLALPAISLASHSKFQSHILNTLGPQGVNLWRLQKSGSLTPGLSVQDSSDLVFQVGHSKHPRFEARWFTQPLDHFSNSSHTFRQRFWVNTRHYSPKAGGPVYILDGGETNGEERLPFLDTGIMEILARATGGVSVVLEHRYYGVCENIASLCS